MSKLILQVIIPLAIFTSTIQSLSSVQLSEACQKHELIYDFQQPIHITNDQSSWITTQLSNRTCHLILNGTANNKPVNVSQFFAIRVTLDSSVDSWSYMSIVDHDEDHMKDSVILNETAVSEQFKQTNSFNVESSCFEINLSDRLQSLETVFNDIKAITITSFTNTEKNQCQSTEFKCLASNICIDMNFRCDQISSCSDNSDEENCSTQPQLPSSTTTSLPIDSTTTSIANGSTTAVASNSTEEPDVNIPNPNIPAKHEYQYLIGLLFLIVFFVCLILGGWIYGRRKRKWREFLAQLDNNTDWEYEQLDDNFYPMGSRSSLPTMNMINMKITSDPPTSNSRQQQTNSSTLTERTPIH